MNDRGRFMAEALLEAEKAASLDEVPIGAVITLNDEVIGRGFNQPVRSDDPTAHAEVVAIRDAARRLKNYRLVGSTLYVTVEPCLMCVGAIIHARIDTVVFGAPEPKAGALESTDHAHERSALNHRITVGSGVRAVECRDLIQRFFKDKRR